MDVTEEMVDAFLSFGVDESEFLLADTRAGLAAVLAIVERDIPVARTQVAAKDRDRFAECAAPEAIAVYLRRARIAQRAAQREVEWLSALLERRTAERDAGSWP